MLQKTLNWQAENVVAQNEALSNIVQSQTRLETRMSTMDAAVIEPKGKINEFHTELLHIATTVKDIAIAN